MAKIRHQIDTLTPNIPEGMTREEIATFAMATQMQGMAIALEMLQAILPLAAQAGAKASATACQAVSEQLIDGLI